MQKPFAKHIKYKHLRLLIEVIFNYLVLVLGEQTRQDRLMRRFRLSSSFHSLCVLGLVALSSTACSSLAARPVPLPEAKRALPTWYPETAWTSEAQSERMFKEGKVVFDTGKATIKSQAEPTLQKLLAYLKANADISAIRIEGHTDARASDDYNNSLSKKRAMAVANWLVDNGLDHSRVLAVAFGESRPLYPNRLGGLAMKENRRAEFHVAEINGNRFRGLDPANGGLVLQVLSKEEREAMKRVGEVPKAPVIRVKREGNIFKDVAKPSLKGKLLPPAGETDDAAKSKKDEDTSE